MISPNQARPKSTPKKITYATGKECCGPMAKERISPKTRTGYKVYPQTTG